MTFAHPLSASNGGSASRFITRVSRRAELRCGRRRTRGGSAKRVEVREHLVSESPVWLVAHHPFGDVAVAVFLGCLRNSDQERAIRAEKSRPPPAPAARCRRPD